MDWESFKVDRFVKLMALAFSVHEHEAAAMRMAGRMLLDAGGTFDDIADILKRPWEVVPSPEARKTPVLRSESLKDTKGEWVMGVVLERLARAETRISTVSQENELYKKQLDDAIRYIVELEAKLSRARERTNG
ncbi:MAG: hypothetical protein FD149_1620 [Rhodospirillaceae bacterium]|nr:MAG: hypothetical protein FD149_1620 [Rhodospirillaceae bacterium]